MRESESIVVQKYGGSSVATVDKVRAVAEKVVATRKAGFSVVVVVSAMGKTTDELLQLARSVTATPPLRELDMLLSAGERISSAVLCMAIQQLGYEAVSLSGGQSAIVTDDVHGDATIQEIRPQRILEELCHGRVVVVAGFQGVNDQLETTTLGRGGSDTTAVALAAALNARHCDIYSDVDGVYSADPRVVDSARRLESLGYEEMQWLARHGARVLNAEAVEFARRKGIHIYARSTFGGDAHTVVRGFEGAHASGFRVAGVTGSADVVRVHADGGPAPQALLSALTGYDVVATGSSSDCLDLLLSTTNVPCKATFARTLGETYAPSVRVSETVASVAAVGLGLGDDPAARDAAEAALRDARVPLLASYTRREALTCLVPLPQVNDGVRAIHRAFIETPRPLAA